MCWYVPIPIPSMKHSIAMEIRSTHATGSTTDHFCFPSNVVCVPFGVFTKIDLSVRRLRIEFRRVEFRLRSRGAQIMGRNRKIASKNAPPGGGLVSSARWRILKQCSDSQSKLLRVVFLHRISTLSLFANWGFFIEHPGLEKFAMGDILCRSRIDWRLVENTSSSKVSSKLGFDSKLFDSSVFFVVNWLMPPGELHRCQKGGLTILLYLLLYINYII